MFWLLMCLLLARRPGYRALLLLAGLCRWRLLTTWACCSFDLPIGALSSNPITCPSTRILPPDLSCLQRIAAHPLLRELPSWSPPLSDAVISVLLARLVEGLDLPQDYRLPGGSDGVRFLQGLDQELTRIDPATLWQQMPADARPSWRHLLTPQMLTRLERNLQTLDRGELRFRPTMAHRWRAALTHALCLIFWL